MNDTYKNIEKLKDSAFKRAVGVKRKVFKKMLKVYEEYEVKKMKLGGRRSSLSVGNKVLIMLEYYREYRTQFHMSISYGVSESFMER